MKFRLSTLLWLIVVVAMGVGWYVDHRRLEAKCDVLNAECAEFFRNQTHVIQITPDNEGQLSIMSAPEPTLGFNSSDPEDRARFKAGKRPKMFAGNGE
jgi:hypothetical protein